MLNSKAKMEALSFQDLLKAMSKAKDTAGTEPAPELRQNLQRISELSTSLRASFANAAQHVRATLLTGEIDPYELQPIVGLHRHELLAVVVSLLPDRDARISNRAFSAIEVLTQDDDIGAVLAYQAALRNAPKTLHYQALTKIRQLGSKAAPAVPDIISILACDDYTNAYAACETLVAIGSEAVPALIEAFQTANSNFKRMIATTFGQFGSTAAPAVPKLVASLKDTDHLIRQDSAAALGKIGSDSFAAVPALILLLSDEDRGVQLTSIQALGRIGPLAESAIDPLLSRLADSHDQIKEKIMVACGRINGSRPDVVSKLKAVMGDRDEHVACRQKAKDILQASAAGKPLGPEFDKIQ
jgi:HEAT repeat protein